MKAQAANLLTIQPGQIVVINGYSYLGENEVISVETEKIEGEICGTVALKTNGGCEWGLFTDDSREFSIVR